MTTHCYPITVLPNTTRLFADFLGASAAGGIADKYARTYANEKLLRRCYPSLAEPAAWMKQQSSLTKEHRSKLADLLAAQNTHPAALANIEKLRAGANAVVTGQQVALFGGPLLTLHKAATAIARAQTATTAGHPHVPIFWLASEDHDLAEVNHAHLLTKTDVETVRAAMPHTTGQPVGNLRLRAGISQTLDHAADLLAHAPIVDALREAYTPGATLAGAFAQFIAGVFAEQGLIVIDASSRDFHALGAATLKKAITDVAPLHTALRKRCVELEQSGYHAQVLVGENASTLFLLDEATGVRNALRFTAETGDWKAGGSVHTTAELLEILADAPERLSPNALLRPVFQDTL
ncbi:MAG TPA: bacillithiol biosynthesis BshC, partial [Acidobacteriaceae bacterium]|nr:bacillithiol biosynthesis BshC [Acidobacteriaceae bacterium]